jgi:hypothetical protein
MYVCVCVGEITRTLDFACAGGGELVEALCYKPEGRGFDSR